MSRYPMKVTRDDDEQFVIAVGTDHASPTLGHEPHCYAQICDKDEEVIWSADARTPEDLVAALDGNPILTLGEFRGPNGGYPEGEERWLTEYAMEKFTHEMKGMRA